jgi:lipid-binding SYLF domain-containing protein
MNRTRVCIAKGIRVVGAAVLSAVLLHGAGAALAQSGTPEQPALSPAEKEAEREARLKLATDGLEKLYKLRPAARESLEKAAGYGVFDVTSIYAILFVGQKGKGVIFDNKSKKPTFMLSARAGTGPGVGKQRVYQVFVFKSKSAMDQFILAGGTGGDVSASVSTGKDGSAYSFNPEIDIYQIPESGMALQASWGGTVYSVDSQLK